MPSNIKIKSLARSAGETVDGSGNPTAAVSGSDMANFFLTGDVNQTVYRHLPDTVGSISGASPRPIGDQYQFIEFDGVVPSIIFTSISTVSDNTDVNIGRRITFAFTTLYPAVPAKSNIDSSCLSWASAFLRLIKSAFSLALSARSFSI
jgi:hypothetical protein